MQVWSAPTGVQTGKIRERLENGPKIVQGVAAPKDAIVGVLGGPTASGKSALALEIALTHGLAIISADSMQVYRGMEVGTGAVPVAERRGVPHHLIAVADPAERFHAARFAEAAREVARQEWEQYGRRSLVVGGTGMWIQALREGLFEGPGRDEAVRIELLERLRRDGLPAIRAELTRVDPVMAAQLSAGDTTRILRALEVFRISGRPLSDWHAEDQERRAALGDLLPLVVVSHPREALNRRINERVEQMIAEGWLEEARALHGMELPPDAPARKALGYRELYRVLDGELSMEEAVAEIKRATRQYARRQMTWFRGQRDVMLLESPTAGEVAQALRLRGES